MRRTLSFLIPSPAMVVALAALVAASAGLAMAASSSSSVIRACANKKTGALRLASKCRRSERAVSWNKEGPVGRRGLTGTTGANGANGGPGVQGREGPRGPGASTLSGTLPDGAFHQNIAELGNGVTIKVNCVTGAMILWIETTSGLSHLQAAGTASVDSGAVGAVRADGNQGIAITGSNLDQYDVIARDSTAGGFDRLDITLEYGEPSCKYWGMVTPSS